MTFFEMVQLRGVKQLLYGVVGNNNVPTMNLDFAVLWLKILG